MSAGPTSTERSRDIAHVGAVELLTAVPDQTAEFFVALLGMSEAERAKGQAWGLKTIDTFHTHGTPLVDVTP